MQPAGLLTRRTALAALGACTICTGASAQPGAPASRRLVFEIWRKGQHIGQHTVQFGGDGPTQLVEIEATMTVKIGPIPVFNYHHQATERWRDGHFVDFRSHTISNGKREQVSASRSGGAVRIEAGGSAPIVAPAGVLPLTHWSQAAFRGPMFNPQTGALLHEAVTREDGQTARLADGRSIPATRYSLSGEAEIVDWYDEAGAWAALHAKAPDGSLVDYRRLT